MFGHGTDEFCNNLTVKDPEILVGVPLKAKWIGVKGCCGFLSNELGRVQVPDEAVYIA